MEPTNQFFVYLIQNRISGKTYVGKTNDLSQRWSAHKSKARNQSELVIHRAIRKYGSENFDFRALSSHPTEAEAYEAEKRTILDLRTTTLEGGYNANSGGLGSFRPSEEVRQKIREANLGHVVTGETREKLRAAHLGTTHTPEARLKMSRSRKGIPKSAVAKQRISEGLVGRPVSDSTRAKIGRAGLGRLHTPEAKLKMSAVHKGRPKSEAHRLRLSEILREARARKEAINV